MERLPTDEVRPGVWAIGMPMPGPLERTYVYALEAGDGVLLIDSGLDSDGAFETLERCLESFGRRCADILGVILTHGHPDHYGLANAIRAHSGAWIGLHPEDARYTAGSRDGSRLEGWLYELGFSGADADAILESLSRWKSPDLVPDRYLLDAAVIEIGNRRLEVIHTPGHSPGHVCVVDHEDRVVFTGDHVLAQTTPNVSVRPDETGSPLDDYLTSLRRMLPLEGFTALPGHEERVAVAPRASEILVHHEEQLDSARSIMRQGSETVEAIAAEMPWTRQWDALGFADRFLAAGETLAHLHVLERRGDAERYADSPQRWRLAIDEGAAA